MIFDGSFNLVKPSIKRVFTIFFLCLILYFAFYSYGVKKTVFLLIPYIVTFLLLELGCRIWLSNFASRSTRAAFLTSFTAPEGLGKESVYVPHHYMLYNLRPNLKLPDGTIHNHLGMRDHRDLNKENDVIRIVFIGGSTTYTIRIKNNKEIFSYRLEKLLNKYYKDLLPDKNIQVINAGMGGATSAENLLRLIFFVSELSPDLVVIQHGLNDITPRMRGNIQSDFSNYRKRWEHPNYFLHKPIASGLIRHIVERSVLLTFISRKLGTIKLSSIGAMVTRCDVPISSSFLNINSTEYFERNTRYMVALCKSMGAKVLLSTEAYTERAGKPRNMAMPEHNNVLSNIAKEEGVLFYDFYNDMIKDDLHMPDGRHVSRKGSDVKADLFYSFFVKQNIIPTLGGK